MEGQLVGTLGMSTDLIRLSRLAAVTGGCPDIGVGVIDGPVDTTHPDLTASRISRIGPASDDPAVAGVATAHGTFTAGILAAGPGSATPGICPDCTIMVRPIFTDTARQPAASADELASAIIDCVLAGSRVLNISAALAGLSPTGTQGLEGALDHARDAGVVVLVAAGNRGLVGGSPLTRHPWVIPVVGFDATGVPLPGSDVSASTGRRGLGALGQDVLGLTPGGGLTTASGTSVATPFVAGAAALIWSEVPQATGAAVRYALTHATSRRRQGVVPPLLDAWRAFSILRQAR